MVRRSQHIDMLPADNAIQHLQVPSKNPHCAFTQGVMSFHSFQNNIITRHLRYTGPSRPFERPFQSLLVSSNISDAAKSPSAARALSRLQETDIGHLALLKEQEWN
jgi:hypothetical protein